MSEEWEALKKAIESLPSTSRSIMAIMPRDCDVSSGIIRSTCDGIYPIRQGIHMKKQKPTIVKVSSRKIDSRESEARELVEWLKTIPTSNFHDPLVPAIVLHRPGIDAVERLTLISWEHLDHKVGSGFDFLRLFGDRGMKRFGVVYMEYVAPSDNDDEHYESSSTQDFHHVVDAVKAFKLRLESDKPFQVAHV